jgi:hypothetical protein
VPLMVGVGNGFEEIFVSPGATHVFGRSGSFTLQAERIPATRLGPQAALEQDLVPPGIPEVVLVLEPEPPPAPGVDRHDTTNQEPTPDRARSARRPDQTSPRRASRHHTAGWESPPPRPPPGSSASAWFRA